MNVNNWKKYVFFWKITKNNFVFLYIYNEIFFNYKCFFTFYVHTIDFWRSGRTRRFSEKNFDPSSWTLSFLVHLPSTVQMFHIHLFGSFFLLRICGGHSNKWPLKSYATNPYKYLTPLSKIVSPYLTLDTGKYTSRHATHILFVYSYGFYSLKVFFLCLIIRNDVKMN
jgi:hypothetical protein